VPLTTLSNLRLKKNILKRNGQKKIIFLKYYIYALMLNIDAIWQQDRARGLGRRTRMETRRGMKMTDLRFQTQKKESDIPDPSIPSVGVTLV